MDNEVELFKKKISKIIISDEFHFLNTFNMIENKWQAVNTRLMKFIEIKNNNIKNMLDEALKDYDLFKNNREYLYQFIIVTMINEIENTKKT